MDARKTNLSRITCSASSARNNKCHDARQCGLIWTEHRIVIASVRPHHDQQHGGGGGSSKSDIVCQQKTWTNPEED